MFCKQCTHVAKERSQLLWTSPAWIFSWSLGKKGCLLVEREGLGENSRWKNSEFKGMMLATCRLLLCVCSCYSLYKCMFKFNNIEKINYIVSSTNIVTCLFSFENKLLWRVQPVHTVQCKEIIKGKIYDDIYMKAKHYFNI